MREHDLGDLAYPVRREPPLPEGWDEVPVRSDAWALRVRGPASSPLLRYLRGGAFPTLEERLGAARCAEIRAEVEARAGLLAEPDCPPPTIAPRARDLHAPQLKETV